MNRYGRRKSKAITMICVRSVIILIAIVNGVENSVIRLEGEKAKSLYDENGKVFVLTRDNFYQSIYDQTYASNVEFYNSFCGFCRNFAPIYKAFAEDVYGWRETIRISAIDCADDANNDICRDMEIMRYPTLRYFPPLYHNESKNLGIEVEHAPMTVGEPHLLQLMENSSKVMSSWPNLRAIESTSAVELFASVPNDVQYIFMVYDTSKEPTVAQKVALDLRTVNVAQIRRVVSAQVAHQLGLTVPLAVYVGVVSTKTIEIVKQTTEHLNRTEVRAIVENYLKSKGIRIDDDSEHISTVPPPVRSMPSVTAVSEADREIIKHVKEHAGVVFHSDIESAIRFSIFHELVKYNNMNAEQIAALKQYLSVLQRYV